jgi:hypothetical protein
MLLVPALGPAEGVAGWLDERAALAAPALALAEAGGVGREPRLVTAVALATAPLVLALGAAGVRAWVRNGIIA